jgi:hypothetical protein
MKLGDLVKYNQSENVLIVVGIKEKYAQKKSMIRCFCPHLKDYYWFYEDHLEVIDESR